METIIKSNDFSNSRYYPSTLDTSEKRNRYYRYALKSLEMHIEQFEMEGFTTVIFEQSPFSSSVYLYFSANGGKKYLSIRISDHCLPQFTPEPFRGVDVDSPYGFFCFNKEYIKCLTSLAN